MSTRSKLATVLAAAMLFPLNASAGKAEANLALASANTAVIGAEQAGAAASAELQLGRVELGEAQRACAAREWQDCERIAHRAHADARLAEARSRQQKAEQAATELQAAVDALRDEIERQGG